CSSRGRVIGSAVLLPPQEDVPRRGSADFCQKASALSEKNNRNPTLGTKAQEERAARDLAEAHDRTEVLHWDVEFRFIVHPNGDGFAVLGQVGALSGYVESIEEGL